MTNSIINILDVGITETVDCTTRKFTHWTMFPGPGGCYGNTYYISQADYDTLKLTGTWPSDPHPPNSGLYTCFQGNCIPTQSGAYSGIAACVTAESSCQVLATITIPSPVNVQIGNNTTLDTVCKDKNGIVLNCPVGLTWSSSNPGIAVVVNGVITAVSVGSCAIRVTSGIISGLSVVIVNPIPIGPCGQVHCYKCTGTGTGCVQDDVTGTLTTCTGNVCGIKWKCTDKLNNICSSGTDSSYTYPDEISCKMAASCATIPTKYNCSGAPAYTCTGPFVVGTYEGQQACLDNCKSSGNGGVITDPCITCDKSVNYCISGICINKKYTLYTGIAVIGLVVLKNLVLALKR